MFLCFSDIYQVLFDIDHSNVFILVSNIEILASKHPQCFAALCSIVRIPFVHLISSCDHINSFLGKPWNVAIYYESGIFYFFISGRVDYESGAVYRYKGSRGVVLRLICYLLTAI